MSGKSTYSDKVADRICEQLVTGMSLRKICLADDMPNASTVFKWLRDNEAFSKQYALAREEQAETLADEIIDIADASDNDTKTSKDGQEVPNNEWITRSRLRVDARKWVASKLKPKKYGDKQLLGSDPDNPLPEGYSVNLVKPDAKR